MALKSDYLKSFLTLPFDGRAFIMIQANELNPLLRCLEIMHESCFVETILPKEKLNGCYTNLLESVFYRVTRKMPIMPGIEISESMIPGITMVKIESR